MLLPFDLDERRRATAPGTSLGGVADGLTAELAPWLHTPLPIPEVKARLTRGGGRCPVHGTLLDFDPHTPHAHRCQRCTVSYTDDVHHQWWAMGAQLFTAERTVHAATLYLLRGGEAHKRLAVHTLLELATRYTSWPNRDNVLGPTRPFFSTYLESIWLLNIAHALALLEAAGVREASDVVRSALLEPSSALIATFHEGRSNRQVWNEVAILSAWTLLGETSRVTRRLSQPGSLRSLLQDGLLTDGTWYEGENYHQFAHRGLWYGVQLLAALGEPLDGTLASRFHEGFAAPFAGLLPDETLPSRRDSQYAVSIRQWRWAEWCELGYTLTADTRLAAVLLRLYDGTVPRRDTGRHASTADTERNGAPTALTRADINWRGLLMANAEPVPRPVQGTGTAGSVLQPRQGLALIRRDAGRVYVALEGGTNAGGHGHPDRLHLTLQQDAQRWLDDPGTGSYTERALHWYRSTLAHHAPLVNGASQQPGPVQLVAFEDRGGAGWVQKRAPDIAPGVTVTRTIVVCDGYLVDVLEWEAPQAVTLTLPLAIGDAANIAEWRNGTRAGAGGLEDGYDFIQNVQEAVQAPKVVQLAPLSIVSGGTPEGSTLQSWYTTTAPATWWRADAPGAPGTARQQRLALDAQGARGRIVGVWCWGDVTHVQLEPEGPVVASITTADGTVASHESAPHGWHIGLVARHSRSSIDLEGLVTAVADDHQETMRTTAPLEIIEVPAVATPRDAAASGATRQLGIDHYVPTEEAWGGGNSPVASVALGATAEHLVVHLQVCTGHPPVARAGGSSEQMPDNPLDNERADVNADGVQCYIGVAGDPVGRWRAAVLIVPLGANDARVTSLMPGAAVPEVRLSTTQDGWDATLLWPKASLPARSDAPLTFDLVVNERPRDRERRRGQLVLSGGGGFGYLRGDRHAPEAPMALQFD